MTEFKGIFYFNVKMAFQANFYLGLKFRCIITFLIILELDVQIFLKTGDAQKLKKIANKNKKSWKCM